MSHYGWPDFFFISVNDEFNIKGIGKRAVVVYSLEYWPVVHDVAGSIPANLMDGE